MFVSQFHCRFGTLLLVLTFLLTVPVSSFVPKPKGLVPTPVTTTTTAGAAAAASADSDATATILKKDYRGEASSLFGNVRIPAALFAGASAGAAFALPLHLHEGLRLGLVKRLYALLIMAALSSQILAVVVSTLATTSLSARPDAPESLLTSSVSELLQDHYYLEWISCRWHFLSGVLMFVVGIGIRAWVTISCPIVAQAALGIIVSCALLCVAFISDLPVDLLDGFLKLPFRYMQLLVSRAQRKPLFALAVTAATITKLYVISKIPHIVYYLATPPV